MDFVQYKCHVLKAEVRIILLTWMVRKMERNSIFIIKEDGLIIREVYVDEVIHGNRSGYIR